MGWKKVTAAAAVASVAAAIAAGTAGAAPGNVFLCYSPDQIDPGVWSQSPIDMSGGLGGNTAAGRLLQQGYWLPIAERTMPTRTMIGDGLYLNCQSGKTAAGVTPAETLVGEAGATTSLSTIGTNDEGYYPEAP